jgi:hypothetical protein
MAVTEYSAIGVDSKGRYVTDPVWTDLDIRSDGFKTVEAAKDHAATLFAQSSEVSRVLVRASIQEYSGGSWKASPVVVSVDRPETA